MSAVLAWPWPTVPLWVLLVVGVILVVAVLGGLLVAAVAR